MAQPQIKQLEAYPAWKEAFAKFKASKFRYGAVVTHEWLYDALGLKAPSGKTPWSEAKKVQLEYMENVIKLREAVQLEELLYLESVPGAGYRVVPPNDQTACAMERASERMQKLLRDTARAVGNIRTDELDDQRRRENMDARAKISSIAGLAKRISGPF
jgi:hypothetical protein